jgi:hypothetical protein
MASEMTTAEMVDFLKSLATQRAEQGQTWSADQFVSIADRLEALDADATKRGLSDEYSSPSVMVRRIAVERDELRAQLAAATARAEKAEAERDAYAKAKAENDERFQIEAGTWRDLYAKAWAECERWRECAGDEPIEGLGWLCLFRADDPDGPPADLIEADAHDAARKEAGL